MERFVKGDIVVVPFPFSDLTRSKRRPALVVQHFDGEDLLLVQITSKSVSDHLAIPLSVNEFQSGSLNKLSNIRPNKLFTSSRNLILYKIGSLKSDKISFVANKIAEMIKE